VLIGVLFVFARPLATVFNRDDTVVATITTYLRIVPLGYGLQGVLMLCAAAMNVLNRPLQAAALSIAQMFVLYVPLALLGSALFGVRGVYGALAVAYVLGGIAAHLVMKRVLAQSE
jgi:Na+-driven multidrug efflux pump